VSDEAWPETDAEKAAARVRAHRDLIRAVRGRAEAARSAIAELRAVLEAAGVVLPPPPPDDDERLWPEAKGGRPIINDHDALRRMAELLETGHAKSIPTAAALVAKEVRAKAERDHQEAKRAFEEARRAGNTKMTAEPKLASIEVRSIASRLERGYRDVMDSSDMRHLLPYARAPELQLAQFSRALEAAGLGRLDGLLSFNAAAAAADLLAVTLEGKALAEACLDLHKAFERNFGAALAPHLPRPPPPTRRRNGRRG
jgi:hypothetical protein